MIWTGRIKKFLKVISGLLVLALEITHGGSGVLLVRGIHLLVIIIVVAGSNGDPPRHHFCPFWLPLGLLLAPLLAALGSAPGCCRGPFSHCPR
jgi:hypothetical protein